MQNIEHFFNESKKNDKLNTSYPIDKSDWKKYKYEGELKFDESKLCFYIHIPFCQSKCKFCEYVKYVKGDEDLEKQYIEILIKDIQNFIKSHRNIELFGFDIGGGTPLILSDENFKTLLEFVKTEIFSKLKIAKDFEASIEATFFSITEDKIKIINRCGFKRISFGLQTVNRKFLKDNHRGSPSLQRMMQVKHWCKTNGIEKINIDLMYGLNGQSKQDLKNSIATIEYFMPEQVTLYEFRTNILKVKENKTKRQLFKQYEFLYKNLIKLGYCGRFGQNTFSLSKTDLGLSSYIKNRMINNISYKGFGISAQSKSREGVSYNIGKEEIPLEKCLENKTFSSEDTYILPKEERLAKYIAISGYCGQFSIKIMDEILGESSREYFKKQFEFLLKKKYIEIFDDIVFITKRGFVCYGAILSLFYPNKKI